MLGQSRPIGGSKAQPHGELGEVTWFVEATSFFVYYGDFKLYFSEILEGMHIHKIVYNKMAKASSQMERLVPLTFMGCSWDVMTSWECPQNLV